MIYLVAPQVWAWRKGRLPLMRRTIDRLLCIFPFEQEFFRSHGIPAEYIGHPLTRLIRPSAPAAELRRRFGIRAGRDVWSRCFPAAGRAKCCAICRSAGCRRADRRPAGPRGSSWRYRKVSARAPDLANFRERFSRSSIQVLEGQTWDVLACADLALAASGTVTVEACLLNTPMVTFYRVNRLSWWMGRFLVSVPFYSMVNLIAGRRVVPELMQERLSGTRAGGSGAAAAEREPGAVRDAAGLA